MTTEKNVNLVNMNISTKSDYDNHGFSDKEESVAISYPVNVSKSSSKKLKWTCCQMVFIILGSLFALVGIIMLAGAYQALFDAILKSGISREAEPDLPRQQNCDLSAAALVDLGPGGLR
ncbi:hypothetical protein OTU49_002852 [Cherax quadricarinatus]|uniref:Uncharacterized protein n=1 Tax=Cherax quadricarinatus TaxID=27406 RepID=A0AAW0X754_CHEQU